MALARPDAILMHCLPAHYGEEIDYGTSRGPHSAIFDQAGPAGLYFRRQISPGVVREERVHEPAHRRG